MEWVVYYHHEELGRREKDLEVVSQLALYDSQGHQKSCHFVTGLDVWVWDNHGSRSSESAGGDAGMDDPTGEGTAMLTPPSRQPCGTR